MINGDWVAFTSSPSHLVKVLKNARQKGSID